MHFASDRHVFLSMCFTICVLLCECKHYCLHLISNFEHFSYFSLCLCVSVNCQCDIGLGVVSLQQSYGGHCACMCFKRAAIKSMHTYTTGLLKASCVSLLGPVAKETGPGLNTSNKYLGGFRGGSEGWGAGCFIYSLKRLSSHNAAAKR